MTRISAPFLDDSGLHRVLTALTGAGHQALIVGGAVRNALLGQPVSDIDIATSSLPEQTVTLTEAAGLRAVPTGIEHGTITVVADGHGYEVTTFRRDVETDGRRAVVAFSDRIEEDAHRRDFTMNALYADASGEVIDPVGGLDDLAARRLRFVGEPRARITEDYLRILRFFRFHAWYGAKGAADPEALAACAELAAGLDGISHERIGAETRKLLAAPDPTEAVALMARAGVLGHILPGADTHDLPALIAAEATLGLPAEWPVRLALLGADNAAQALRLSRDETRLQDQIATALTLPLPAAAYRFGPHIARSAALIATARGTPPAPDWQQQIAHAADAQLPIAARHLMPELSGPAIGAALRQAETAFIDSGFSLSKQELLALALGQDRQRKSD
ncbi:CCA tRNA nucleotidyltransferase [Paracoccus litorisediminis]|jgi:poly(A) polymerase|uniref:CCA tRNA nucleotidyltransferase n=1 Tax=Paracoccus litorisediminis TaxID=2006130 RepID=A0A844HNR1_9RHOB|nr:CCA tRNA nucleotidyltransferase [Paracoccus litorisediminis]MTH61983.1 CCA tRNA nucleotidyltransferase [Paracoccus litorisediminis]